MKKLKDYQRNKKKIVIFDFDGVLAETIKIKGLVFYKIFEKEGRNIQNYAFSYHIKNAGINRKIKFKEIYKTKLKKNINNKELSKLSVIFNKIYSKYYKRIKINRDFINFINKNKKNINFYISSTAPKKEIINILKNNDCYNLFKKIYGSNIKKNIAIRNIIKHEEIAKKDIIFIGDTIHDYNVAKQLKINFISYKFNSKNDKKNKNIISSKSFNKVVNEYFSNN